MCRFNHSRLLSVRQPSVDITCSIPGLAGLLSDGDTESVGADIGAQSGAELGFYDLVRGQESAKTLF